MDRTNQGAQDSRLRILEAATSRFAESGYEGARTQAIADEAGVNKAMLYYHFKDKKDLYRETFRHLLSEIFGQVFPIFTGAGIAPRDRIRMLMEGYRRFFAEHPDLRAFMLRELASGAQVLKEVLDEVRTTVPGSDPAILADALGGMMREGGLRTADPRQTLLHLVSLAVFPYLARPVLEAVLGLDEEASAELLGSRPQHVMDLLEHGLFTGGTQR